MQIERINAKVTTACRHEMGREFLFCERKEVVFVLLIILDRYLF